MNGRRRKATMVAGALVLLALGGGAAGAGSSPTGAVDAAWSGLSMEEQAMFSGLGWSVVAVDAAIVAYRDGLFGQCMEDEPCWDCHTMGNGICGAVLPETL